MKLLRRLLLPVGLLTMLAGLLMLGVCVVDFMDPVSSKMADDNDPFGPPTPRHLSALGAVCGLTVSLAGFALTFRSLATPFSPHPEPRSVTS
ncbi:MAG: hypothetical protein V4662_19600 [Verrucomicrobiota bacterium]